MKKIVLLILFLQTFSINSAEFFSNFFKDIVLKSYDFDNSFIKKNDKQKFFIAIEQIMKSALIDCGLKHVQYKFIEEPNGQFSGQASSTKTIKKNRIITSEQMITINITHFDLDIYTFIIYHECGHLSDPQILDNDTYRSEQFADHFACCKLIRKKDFKAINAYLLNHAYHFFRYGKEYIFNARNPTNYETYQLIKKILRKHGFETYALIENKKIRSVIHKNNQILSAKESFF